MPVSLPYTPPALAMQYPPHVVRACEPGHTPRDTRHAAHATCTPTSTHARVYVTPTRPPATVSTAARSRAHSHQQWRPRASPPFGLAARRRSLLPKPIVDSVSSLHFHQCIAVVGPRENLMVCARSLVEALRSACRLGAELSQPPAGGRRGVCVARSALVALPPPPHSRGGCFPCRALP